MCCRAALFYLKLTFSAVFLQGSSLLNIDHVARNEKARFPCLACFETFHEVSARCDTSHGSPCSDSLAIIIFFSEPF
jgi:hypothetical protein